MTKETEVKVRVNDDLKAALLKEADYYGHTLASYIRWVLTEAVKED